MFRKKTPTDPDEMRSRLNIKLNQLEALERKFVQKEQDARSRAKNALRDGNDRSFTKESRRASLMMGQRTVVSGMVDTATGIRDVMDLQQGMSTIVGLGNDLREFQQHIGIKPAELEKAMTQIATSMQRVQQASQAFTETIDGVTAGGADMNEAEAALRKELLAELQGEAVQADDLETRIKAAQKAQA